MDSWWTKLNKLIPNPDKETDNLYTPDHKTQHKTQPVAQPH